jgi:cardiolipin synthase (CMP-forming)
MLASSYLVLSFKSLVPFWLMTTIITRDIVISLGFLLLHRLSIRTAPSPSYLSKATTVAQIVTVIYVLCLRHSPYEMVFFYGTAILTGLSGIQYIFLGYNALFRKEIV